MEEREIDLVDMLHRIAQRWRRVIVGAIVVGLLAGLYKAATGTLIMLDPEKLAEAQEKYQIELDDYEATGERLRTQIRNYRENSANQQEYNEKSVLMTIDPMNKYVGSFVYYVDSKFRIDPTLTYQNIDLTNRLLMAYSRYLTGGEMYNEILEKSAIVDEVRFLTEILWSSVDGGASSITVNCVGKSEADVQEILGLVKSGLAEKRKTILSTIGDHDCEVLMESLYSTIDLELDATQKANLQAIGEYANKIGETNLELEDWDKEGEPRKEFGWWSIVKQSIKFAIIGGVVGFAVMCGYFAAVYVFSGTVNTDYDWRSMGIPVLGYLSDGEGKKKTALVDRWIANWFAGGKPQVEPNTLCAVTANNVGGALREKGAEKAVIVSDLEPSAAEKLVRCMDAASPETSFVYAGNAQADPETVKKVSGSSDVLFLGKVGVTHLDNVRQTQVLLNAWGKKVFGAIVVE